MRKIDHPEKTEPHHPLRRIEVSEHHKEEALPLLDTYPPPAADLDRIGKLGLQVGGAAAVATAALAFMNPEQFFRSYLVSVTCGSWDDAGSYGLMLIDHLSAAAWGLMIRRIFEAATPHAPGACHRLRPRGARNEEPLPCGRGTTKGTKNRTRFRAAYLTPNGLHRAGRWCASHCGHSSP